MVTENLTAPAVLLLKWTEWGYGTANIYYSVTYSVENISGGIGELKRRLQNSSGGDQTILVANNIYYNPADPANTTNVTHASPVISLKVAARFGSASETRDYQIYRRPSF